jgi:hypothetical protein
MSTVQFVVEDDKDRACILHKQESMKRMINQSNNSKEYNVLYGRI